MSKEAKKIVCLGGGNAMPKAVLAGLKKYPVKLSVICAMLDSGGSAGRLRKDYKVVSPGDIRRAFVALANASPVIENLFNYRFQTGFLKGHNFANLLITALELSSNNYEKTIKEIREILNVKHEVLPVTLEKAELFAVLENGKLVAGETNIDIPKHNRNLKIKRVFLKPKARAYPKALKAIRDADLAVIGPGDLYSSLAQILLVAGISKALKESKAKKVYICNIMTKKGETNDFSVSDFVQKVEAFLGKELDFVIFNTKRPSKKTLAKYKKTNPELLNPAKANKDCLKNKKYIGADLLAPNSLSHDPKKLSKIILRLCKL